MRAFLNHSTSNEIKVDIVCSTFSHLSMSVAGKFLVSNQEKGISNFFWIGLRWHSKSFVGSSWVVTDSAEMLRLLAACPNTIRYIEVLNLNSFDSRISESTFQNVLSALNLCFQRRLGSRLWFQHGNLNRSARKASWHMLEGDRGSCAYVYVLCLCLRCVFCFFMLR